MTTPVSSDLAWLDDLERAHAAATPGPWHAATAPAEGSAETHAEYLVGALRPEEGRPLWVAWAAKVDALHGDDTDYVVPIVTGDGPASEANARYVAAMHAALPTLIAELRKRDAALRAVEGLGPDAVLVEGDWVSPSREAYARDLTKSWADAASNAGCPATFVNRMRTFVELHDRLAAAALAEMRPAAAEEAVQVQAAATPDPRFRDQLAEVLECANWCNSNYPSTGGGLSLLSPAPGCDCLETHRLPQADTLLPLIAAEVEARVQAAANQRAAEALELASREDGTTVAKLSPVERLTCRIVKTEDLLDRAAALAPVPDDAGGGERR